MKKIFQSCCLLCLSLAQPLFAQDEAALQTEFVFTIKAGIDDMIPLGETSDGERRAIPITGGSFAGEGISGEVIPGGADYQLVRPDGVVELKAVYMIRTDDGAVIKVENSGLIISAEDGDYVRTSPKFWAPAGKYEWLNEHLFLSSVRTDPEQPGYVFIRVYKVL